MTALLILRISGGSLLNKPNQMYIEKYVGNVGSEERAWDLNHYLEDIERITNLKELFK
ncbi:2559_t:CDS:2 [Acaulospora colombiana]|uniref:2559_t:CDS:1 n=1 Tax=Acaulospora colombiana TaxID=27376 RepID=A0ACA9KIP3_9GLOM|nr:2559_t:CDS:2 [Acaulospora colombiana]